MTSSQSSHPDPVPKIDSLPLDEPAKLKLKETWRRVENPASAGLLWERLLTPEQRATLGGDLPAAFRHFKGTTNMWLKVRPMFWARAIVYLGRDIGHLSKADCRWLSRQIRQIDPTLPADGRKARRPTSKNDPNRVLEKAFRRGARLILIQGEGERRLLWDGRLHDKPWARHEKLWEFLWKLVEKARIAEGARWDELTRSNRDCGSDNVIKHRRYRLKPLLPPGLNKLIVPQESGYLLSDIAKRDLVLIELKSGQYLDEILPGS